MSFRFVRAGLGVVIIDRLA